MRRTLPWRLCAPVLLCTASLACGCSAANVPLSEGGVRAFYRSIGLEASAGNFGGICRTYTDRRLRAELSPASRKCYSRTFERWAEKVRLSKIKPGTRIVLTGREATIYDGSPPEKVVYTGGEWRLAAVPEIASGG